MKLNNYKLASEALRVKTLGNWPEYINEVQSLIGRFPENNLKSLTAPGFDAGIACLLDLIPRKKQKLSAILHAAYTPEAVEQIREEIKNLTVNSETCWWLAACSLCNEDGVNYKEFCSQVDSFIVLAKDGKARKKAAKDELAKMLRRYHVIDGIAFASADGGMQAAYIAGHDFSVGMGDGLWFVGTYLPTLGIPSNFKWSDKKDSLGRDMSGPVHGSKQFVKCSSLQELVSVLKWVKA